MASLIGTEIGKYRITERIGRGGMAEVYLGIHTHLDRKVAVKVLHSHLLEGGDFVARFKREAKAVANLRHPNIVQVHDFDIQDEMIFMVMEYIDGANLHTRLVEVGNKGERLPIKLIGSIINDIAGALDYAHSKAMLHRDIKPSNILLDKDDKAYLTDFGIAKLLDDQKFTATGQLIGTPAYMSPEQGMGEDLSEESDIYSLGIVAFEMLTGQVPYDAKTPIGIVHKQINAPVPNMSELVDGVPETAQAVLDRALAKTPEGRYNSAQALVGALKVALQALESTEPLETELPAEEKAAADEVLDAPTITMQDPELDQATVVMEKEKPVKSPPEVVQKEELKKKVKKEPKPKVIKEKKKIPLWAYIAGGVVVVAGIAAILTQVLDFGATGKPASLPSSTSETAESSTTVIITEAVEVRFDAYHTSNGLSILGGGDDDYEFVQVGIKQCWRSGNGRALPTDDGNTIEDMYLEFDIYDDFIYQVPLGAEVRFLIGYLDEGTDSFFIEYDAHSGGPYNNGEFKPSEMVTKTGSGNIKTAEFIFEDAYLANRNGGTDFRIVDMGDGAETICSLVITLLPTETDGGSPGEMGAEELFHQGQDFLDQGKSAEAIEYFDLALNAGIVNANLHHLRAWANLNLGHIAESMEDWSRAIEIDPDPYEYWMERGLRKFDLGDLEGAIEDLLIARDRAPNEWAVHHGLGELYFFSGQDNYIEDAIASFDRALEIDPENPYSRRLRGELRWSIFGDAEGALEDLNIAVEFAQEGDPGPFNMRGLVYKETGQYELCIPDYHGFVARDPENPWAYRERGDCFAGLGDHDAARQDYVHFMEITEGNPDWDDQREQTQNWLNEH